MSIRSSLQKVLHVAPTIVMQHATNLPDTAILSTTGDATNCLKASNDKEVYATNVQQLMQQGAQISATDRVDIVAWLDSIGENDPACVAEVLEHCRADADALAYFLGRAKEVA